jgi:hypothetical protein
VVHLKVEMDRLKNEKVRSLIIFIIYVTPHPDGIRSHNPSVRKERKIYF